ncbi:MmpS family transport accessory protein [Saccharopolyspora kobensis]|uniref:MmpS family transport accessory protein n=1 Tax=Saccharopolyspora kobensis TaxID=146035 RepID=UPI000D3793A3|nr:MmpS family transport accessory protein [Saccharopolyspora kobensis]
MKARRVRNLVALLVLGFVAVIGSGCAIPPPATNSPAGNAGGGSTVEIIGSGEAMVTITAGGTSSNTVQLPHTAELPEGFASVSVNRSPSVESYMNGKPDTAEIRCRIVRDGKVVDEQSASGEFAMVTCNKFM